MVGKNATLTLLDYGRVARHSGRITVMIDGHVSLLATFELV
jgi:prepilin-type processing-associated H-X9-DG protein